MFRLLGELSYRWRWMWLALGAFGFVVGGWSGSHLLPKLSTGGYDNPKSESAQVAARLKDRFHMGEGTLVVLLSSRDESIVISPAFSREAKSVLDRLRAQPGVVRVLDPYSLGTERMVSADKRTLFAVAELDHAAQDPAAIQRLRRAIGSPLIDVKVGGAPAINADVIQQLQVDLHRSELIAAVVTAVLLLLVFGSAVAAALPLAMGGLAILLTLALLDALVRVTPVSVFAVQIVSMLGMGLAIDYSLFIVSRFREELARGKPVPQALVRTLETAGHTVFFSGLTVALSLLSLLFFPEMLLRSMGFGGSLGVLFAMAASLTVLPAALAVLGPRINALAVRKTLTRPLSEEQGFWYRLSQYVMRHPVKVLVLTLVPLLIAGSPFLHVRFSMPDERNVPPNLESRQVATRLKAMFSASELEPVQLLVHFSDGEEALSPPHLDSLYAYVQHLKSVPGVVRVDSLVSVDPQLDSGAPNSYHRFYRQVASGELPEGKTVVQQFSSASDARVAVYFQGDPRSEEQRALLARLRAVPPPEATVVQMGGVTAELVDLLHYLRRTVPVAIGAIVVVIFALLFLMLGSLVVPLKAVILNFLSLAVTFGALVFVFQDGHFATLLGAEKLGSIDALQPMLIFVMAFGLSMDYEVFLLSRIKESFDQTKDNTAAVALGVQRTGGIITSAAALLAAVLISFASGKVLSLKQVVLGLLLAVLVDATLVRSLLVPATMVLLGRRNWWAPPPLRRLYKALKLGEPTSED